MRLASAAERVVVARSAAALRLAGAALVLVALLALPSTAMAQGKKVQNKPYIDLRPFHFGVVVGMHLQDMEMLNVGPQTVVADDGTTTQLVTCDQDRWDPGFNVGVLGEWRMNDNFYFRLSPTLYFGNRHLMFTNLTTTLENGQPITQTQDMKSVYVAAPMDLIFAAPRFNNRRPYVLAGINPMLNLSGKDSDYLKLKRYDLLFEVGVGCNMYMPFFKLRPELKFCYGLINSLDTNHASTLKDDNMRIYSSAVSRATSKMIVLSFYFE